MVADDSGPGRRGLSSAPRGPARRRMAVMRRRTGGSGRGREDPMRRFWNAAVIACLLAGAFPAASIDAASGWQATVPVVNQVASTPFSGGGYPVPEGGTAPV